MILVKVTGRVTHSIRRSTKNVKQGVNLSRTRTDLKINFLSYFLLGVLIPQQKLDLDGD